VKDVTEQTASPAPEPQPVLPQASYLTQGRQELMAWMERNGATSLADLYHGAIRLIADLTFPGRLRLVCHAVREIRNRLPDIISGKDGGGRFDYVGPLDSIAKRWVKAGFSIDGSIPVSAAESGNNVRSPSVQVPRPLFQQIAQLMKAHVARRVEIRIGGKVTRSKNIEAAIRLFEACAPENKDVLNAISPVIFQWVDVTEWFMQRAHDSGETLSDFDEQELQRQFQLFETALTGLARGFFTALDELDEILEEANA
jgi:hypothetical protein